MKDLDIVISDDGWLDTGMGFPYQSYLDVTYQGREYELYLRWRWDDPWEGHIIDKQREQGGGWSVDLFEQGNLFFLESELESAKAEIVEIANHLIPSNEIEWENWGSLRGKIAEIVGNAGRGEQG